MARIVNTPSAYCGLVMCLVVACGGRMGEGDSVTQGRTLPTAAGARGTGATGPTGATSATSAASAVGGAAPTGAGGSAAKNTLGGKGAGAGMAGVAGATHTLKCPELIDDMEQGSGVIPPCDHRVGVWYAFNNSSANLQSQWPATTSPGVPISTSDIPGGRAVSRRAMHSYGTANGATHWWAGIGLDFSFDGQHYGTYDASAFNGVTFWIQGDPKTRLDLRVGTKETNAPIYGGTCDQGYCEPAAVMLDVRSHWRQRWVSFDSMASDLTANALTNLQFYCPIGCNSFDFWVDDIAFYSGSPSCCENPPASCRGELSIEDAVLGGALKKRTMNSCDVCAQTSLRVDQSGEPSPSSDLTGFGCFTNLAAVSLDNVPVNDVALFAELTFLEDIKLIEAGITDVRPLAKLTELESLDLAKNAISSSTALAGLRGMKSLNLESNRLSEVTELAEMSKLESLNLSNNGISDIKPLSQLASLTSLNLSGNAISDLSPLAALKELALLDLSNNQIVDLSPLAGLTKLTTLKLSGNRIVKTASLAQLTALDVLLLDKNQVDDLSGLANLTQLATVALAENAIFDLGPLAKLDTLFELDLTRNRIVDASGLNPVLQRLTLNENLLVSLAPLIDMVLLTTLNIANNQVADLTPIAHLPQLESLTANNNALVSLQPLTDATKLHLLYAANNRISDLSPLLNIRGFDTIYYERWSSLGNVSVQNNAIDCASQADNIAKLRARRVEVTVDCP